MQTGVMMLMLRLAANEACGERSIIEPAACGHDWFRKEQQLCAVGQEGENRGSSCGAP